MESNQLSREERIKQREERKAQETTNIEALGAKYGFKSDEQKKKEEEAKKAEEQKKIAEQQKKAAEMKSKYDLYLQQKKLQEQQAQLNQRRLLGQAYNQFGQSAGLYPNNAALLAQQQQQQQQQQLAYAQQVAMTNPYLAQQLA